MKTFLIFILCTVINFFCFLLRGYKYEFLIYMIPVIIGCAVLSSLEKIYVTLKKMQNENDSINNNSNSGV